MNFKYPIANFCLQNTLECGQCFRWKRQPDGSYYGVADNHSLHIEQKGNTLVFYNTTEKEFLDYWQNYFDFGTDYDSIYQKICQDPIVQKAYDFTGGIHILRQQSWEALCSFIISQNNNIPRITGIIDRLCRQFGEPLADGGFSFPSAQRLSKLTIADLSDLRAGFRSKYILDAAQKIADGTVDMERIRRADLPDARKELQQICGVGPKVAECALLFGFYRVEAFPLDVWMKRAMTYFYQNGFPQICIPYGGIAQQVIFHYIRCCDNALPADYRK